MTPERRLKSGSQSARAAGAAPARARYRQTTALVSVLTGPSTKTGALVTQKRWSCSTNQLPVSMAPARNVRPALCQVDSLVTTRGPAAGQRTRRLDVVDRRWLTYAPARGREPVRRGSDAGQSL